MLKITPQEKSTHSYAKLWFKTRNKININGEIHPIEILEFENQEVSEKLGLSIGDIKIKDTVTNTEYVTEIWVTHEPYKDKSHLQYNHNNILIVDLHCYKDPNLSKDEVFAILDQELHIKDKKACKVFYTFAEKYDIAS